MPTLVELRHLYSIANDTLNGKVDSDSLTIAIRASEIPKALDHIDTAGDDLIIYFKDILTLIEIEILTAIVNEHTGISPVPLDRTEDGIQKVSSIPALQTVSPLWMVSHNYGDKLTWWQESARVVDEPLVQISEFEWQTTQPFVLDLEHGRLVNEDDVASGPLSLNPLDLTSFFPDGNNLIPTLMISGEIGVRIDEDPLPQDGAITYKINYSSGIITFGDNRSGQNILFSYHYAQGAGYKFPPIPDKLYKISITQAKWSNIDMNSLKMAFQIFKNSGEVEIARRIYKGTTDYLFASVGSPGRWVDPATGQVFTTMEWDYKRPASPASDSRIAIKSSKGMYVYLVPQHAGELLEAMQNSPGNPYLVVTLFATSEPDV